VDLQQVHEFVGALVPRCVSDAVVRELERMADEFASDAAETIERVAWRMLEPPYTLDGAQVCDLIGPAAESLSWLYRGQARRLAREIAPVAFGLSKG